MTTPSWSTLSLSGFAAPWFFACALVIATVVAIYVFVGRKPKRVLRFANMELLERVAPARPRRWRHLSVILLAVALAMLVTALAGPTAEARVPRDQAVVMLVIDVSESMAATDVAPSRIEAAKEAGERFADQLNPKIDLGVVKFSSAATMLVAPTTDRSATRRAIDTLQPEPRTATGEGIFTALQAIATIDAVVGGSDGKPPPARIVLESDGKETVPSNPDDPRGAFTAARAAHDQGVEISTISFGTPYGTVDLDGSQQPVPVDDETLRKIAEITHGKAYHAGSLDQLEAAYTAVQDDVGFQTIRTEASSGWILCALVLIAAAFLAGLRFDRALPG